MSTTSLAADTFGRAIDDFYVFFNSNRTKRVSPTVLGRWNGKAWTFVDRFKHWMDARPAQHADGSFVLVESEERLLGYSSEGVLDRKYALNAPEFQDPHLAVSPADKLLIISDKAYHVCGRRLNCFIGEVEGSELKRISTRRLAVMMGWTFDSRGNLWAFGPDIDAEDYFVPVLCNLTTGEEVALPFEPSGSLLKHTLLITKDDRAVITVPFGEVYQCQLDSLRRIPSALKRVGTLRPMIPPEQSNKHGRIVRSICETHNGDVLLGNMEGLTILRGEELHHEFAEPRGYECLNPIDNLYPFLPFAEGTVVCRKDGVHIMDGDRDRHLPPIDPAWFEAKGQSSRGVPKIELT